MAKKKGGSPGRKVLADNRKARFNYHILENFEAGLVLTGAEIKSIRAGKINLAESYVRPYKGELFLLNAHVSQYSHCNDPKYNPTRQRKLLLHRKEINKLQGRVESKGMTIVPLKIYLKRGYAKLEIGLAKGKAAPDKRQSIKNREAEREMARELKRRS